MKDTVRWTASKITRRLELIEPLVYRNRTPLAPFSYKRLDGYLTSLSGLPDAKEEGWTVIPPGTYWGEWYADFALHSHFTIPQDWDSSIPSALYLPLGDSGDFCHPEALVFIDGEPCGSCDRYHQEVFLPRSLQDGERHSLELIGWTGIGDLAKGLNTRLYMQPCYIVQIHQPLRELVALARVAVGIVKNLVKTSLHAGKYLTRLTMASNDWISVNQWGVIIFMPAYQMLTTNLK